MNLCPLVPWTFIAMVSGHQPFAKSIKNGLEMWEDNMQFFMVMIQMVFDSYD